MNTIATVCAGIAAALALSGCATHKQMDITNVHLQNIQVQLSMLNKVTVEQLKRAPKNPSAQNVCLLAGQIYSEGAVAAGKVCTRVAGKFVFGMPDPESFVWQPESRPRVFP
ncbi:hypothetical protein [Pseudomonas coleopterorum]|uniref:hypothetical protein n=1 Tax=Pseudomonas coleopterorum TaxID=1605838 RepID=UPI00089565A1|nr:hypothetical protein [Pseudomonas coleopterorum]SEE90989.1 murein lipoprotein [Pseudomonas coleopterorum]